jgi:hypothetical protein
MWSVCGVQRLQDLLQNSKIEGSYTCIFFVNKMAYSIPLKENYGIFLTRCFINPMDSNTVISGSFALASYLTQEGIPYDFDPQDIDIFVSTHRVKGVDEYIEYMRDFMSTFGYTMKQRIIRSSGRGHILANCVKDVTFQSPYQTNYVHINVIDTVDIIEYIKTECDLSICATWWNSSKNCFETLDPYYTKRKEMYRINRLIDDRRVQKYIGRGFKIIKVPCPVILERDLRLELDSEKFDGIMVYNIFTLEELSIREFLRSIGDSNNEWNIVLKAGASYYGFDRGELIQFMATKKVFVRGIQDEVYETPFNQCITAEAFTHLKYADYTIYELEEAYTETVNGIIKSLFNCRCYTVGQWIRGSNTTLLLPVVRFIHDPLSSDFIREADASLWRHAHSILILNNIGPFLNSMITIFSNWCLLLISVFIVYIYTLGFGVAMLNIYNRLDFWELIYIYAGVNCVTFLMIYIINYRYH